MTWMWRWSWPSELRSCISARLSSRARAPRSCRIRARGRSTLASDALVLSDIDAYYGDSHVLQKVSFRLGEGRLLGLLGRNGAGKSTAMNVTVGLLPPRHGAVTVYGRAVTGALPRPSRPLASRLCRRAAGS